MKTFKQFRHWYYEVGEQSACTIAITMGITLAQVQLWIKEIKQYE